MYTYTYENAVACRSIVVRMALCSHQRETLQRVELTFPKNRTLNDRLPLEHGSDRPQTSGKRVSDDLQLSIFQLKKKIGAKKHYRRTSFFEELLFLKIWRSKSGYRQLHRPNSLPRMRFSGLCDASPARNINVCVFDLDLGQK